MAYGLLPYGEGYYKDSLTPAVMTLDFTSNSQLGKSPFLVKFYSIVTITPLDDTGDGSDNLSLVVGTTSYERGFGVTEL